MNAKFGRITHNNNSNSPCRQFRRKKWNYRNNGLRLKSALKCSVDGSPDRLEQFTGNVHQNSWLVNATLWLWLMAFIATRTTQAFVRPTDRVSRKDKAIGSHRLSVHLKLYTLSFEPTDLWTWVCVCVCVGHDWCWLTCDSNRRFVVRESISIYAFFSIKWEFRFTVEASLDSASSLFSYLLRKT